MPIDLKEVNRFLGMQSALQEMFIAQSLEGYRLTAADLILKDAGMPMYFELGRKYELKDNELTRALLRPVFMPEHL